MDKQASLIPPYTIPPITSSNFQFHSQSLIYNSHQNPWPMFGSHSIYPTNSSQNQPENYQSQWYYGSQNYQNLPSCAQQTTPAEFNSYYQDGNNMEFYDPGTFYPTSNYYIPNEENAQNGGDSSDIIIEDWSEDSSEEVSSSATEDEEDIVVENTNIYICIICNLSSSETIYFPFLDESLQTTTTRVAMITKTQEILSKTLPNIDTSSYICNVCVNLINTIDCLEYKLQVSRQQFIEGHKKTINILESTPLKRICKICNKYFSQTDFNKHLHPSNLKCPICHRNFTMKRLLDNHISRHNKYLCHLCGKAYIKRYSLDTHLRQHDKDYTEFCHICNKGFITKQALQNHVTTHTDIKPFTCDICLLPFRTKSHLNEHRNACSNEYPFHCELCPKKFPSQSKLNDHTQSTHNKKYTCGTCNRGFRKISNYKTHLLSHSDTKLFQCSKCPKSYKTLSNLTFHAKEHGVAAAPFSCDVCSKTFRRKENFVAHKNSHLNVLPFKCEDCGKAFAAKKHLDAHGLRIHKRDEFRKQVCPICGKGLMHSLTQHMRLHSGEKPFKCTVCPVAFISKSALQKHSKRKHS